MSDENTDRISYSEGVKINIGDYESRDVHVSYSTSVKEGENTKKAISRARKTVQEKLMKFERQIRKASQDDVDFETMEKLNYYK